MSKQKNLNSKDSEYIEKNFLDVNPEGLPPIADISTSQKVVVAPYIPQMKKIVFHNGRDPGYPLDFHYHSKTHPLKHYTLYHGKEHELSEEIIDHLESCGERQYGYRQGVNGHPEMYVKGMKYNFRCQSVKRVA